MSVIKGSESLNTVTKRTIGVIGNPDIYTDMLSEMICNGSWIRQSKTKDIGFSFCEENDCPWSVA